MASGQHTGALPYAFPREPHMLFLFSVFRPSAPARRLRCFLFGHTDRVKPALASDTAYSRGCLGTFFSLNLCQQFQTVLG